MKKSEDVKKCFNFDFKYFGMNKVDEINKFVENATAVVNYNLYQYDALLS